MKYSRACIFAALLSASAVAAQPSDQEPSESSGIQERNVCEGDCVESNSWAVGAALGYGKYSSPLHSGAGLSGKERHIAFLPSFYVYADNFYIENTAIGYTLFEDQFWSIDIKGELNPDGVYFQRNKLDAFLSTTGSAGLFPLPYPDEDTEPKDVERSLSYLGGVGVDYYPNASWRLSIDLLTDISAVHHGQKLGLGLAYQNQFGDLTYQLSTGAQYRSQALNDYYYGVENGELIYRSPAYLADAGWNLNYELNFNYPIYEKFAVIGRYQYQDLSEQIVLSPLVEDNSTHYYFIGVSWQIGGGF
ncbi:MipA/OmpV family protein [Thalassotalea litorea]|uniref:MipA/OmpV family protein n=1 Tax=Thalassotalea litorea TaxID=2020715 RepID=UPI003736677B